MRCIIITVAILAVAVNAGPVKDELKKTELLSQKLEVPSRPNATLPADHSSTTIVSNATLPKHTRSKRDCGIADLDKIEAKISEALINQITLLLGGRLPEGGNRSRRSISEAAAASQVHPDGTINSLAAAKGSNDPPVSTEEPILTNTHQLPPNMRLLPEDSGTGGAGGAGLPDEMPATTPIPEDQVTVTPLQPHPIAGTGNTVQKVSSKANMDKGTAVASAIAKRSAVIQTVETSGGKAMANAESHKGADTNVQSVTANGTHVGIASALVDNRNASLHRSGPESPEVVLQNVAASGVKSVATATNNKGSGSSVQDVMSTGDEISVASVVSTRSKREVFKIVTEGMNDGLLEYYEIEDDGSYKPEQILIRQRVTRSPCISTKMDDNLRKLIQDSVAAAFADVKKDLKL